MRAPYSPILAGYRRLQSRVLHEMTDDGFLVRRNLPLVKTADLASVAGYRVLEAILPRGEKPRLSPELRGRLLAYYDEDITGLERRLDRDPSAWRR